ncbi:hypothetical protein COCSUDRAFT_40625 [Coccomyxa subellipsoidea C-169]|uniref:Uncharacterized protein n=1 Tax=Coccomyxa subellipsoidea (strain C-169) TaxID=574566 RepID=I0Z3Y5_COCSC|nr:hypothetical protein COCSUDRAFT_40625 [Coccomyxa subellipsoidea C-169]EIE25354.1 hypothetical protein COCSUDRAFT_40625 [Coccomyxa subellipsoidea C-169]|eukprot:XP_005649898.1 hypothetical protein COCSUDRAFT_40625 [Coccomyxa subellipsoidea C-169]
MSMLTAEAKTGKGDSIKETGKGTWTGAETGTGTGTETGTGIETETGAEIGTGIETETGAGTETVESIEDIALLMKGQPPPQTNIALEAVSTEMQSTVQHGKSRGDTQTGPQEGPGRPEKINFVEAIPGYEEMSAGERMKARTKLLLARTNKQDIDSRQQWTRFVFNKDALLDEEGAQPGDAFGGGANAVSLKVPAAQARQEERILSAQEAHEACASSRSLQVIYVWQ